MKRLILNELIKWKESKDRKPLILCGARQVGKSWIIENDFTKTFKDGIFKIDFSYQNDFFNFFENTKDPNRIIENISLLSGRPITKDTLIFFDEIQACPNALTSLKYFNELANDYYVVAAGSLLGISSSNFPVGKVNFLDLYPMTIEEFLDADNSYGLINSFNMIKSINPLPTSIHNLALEKLKMYFLIGGMPEAIKKWVFNRDIKQVDDVQLEILKSYCNDFSKHADKFTAPKIWHLWNSLPSQLSKESKKFIYSVARPGARAREYESALEWLIKASLVCKVSKISKPSIPLASFEDLLAFKIYSNDVGLLRQQSALSYELFAKKDALFEEGKGALTENYVINNLYLNFQNGFKKIYYWKDENNAEVDFVIQYRDLILPIEVKSGSTKKKHSLVTYIQKFNPKLAIRLSINNLKLDGKILNVPLYLINYLPKLIDIALKDLNK